MFCGFFGDGMGLFSGFAVEVGFVLGWRLGLGLCGAVKGLNMVLVSIGGADLILWLFYFILFIYLFIFLWICSGGWVCFGVEVCFVNFLDLCLSLWVCWC